MKTSFVVGPLLGKDFECVQRIFALAENGRQAFTFSHASHHAAAAAVAAAKQLLVMEGTAQAQLRAGIPWWKILFVNAGLAISFKMILTQSIIHYRFWFNSSKIFVDLGSKNQYDGSLHVNDTYLTWFDTSMVIELPPLFAYFVRAQHFVEPLNDAKDSARRTEGLTECHGAKRREHYTRITLPLSLSAAYLGAHSGADQPYYAPWLPLLPPCPPAIRPMESKGFFLFCAESVAPFPAQRSPSTDPHGAMRPLPI